MKKFTCSLALITLLVAYTLLCSCSKTPEASGLESSPTAAIAASPTESTATAVSKASLLDGLQLTLPQAISRQRISDTQEDFLKNGTRVGGILLVDIDPDIYDDILNVHYRLDEPVFAAMKTIGFEESEWYFGGSSSYGLHQVSFGTDTTQTIVYTVRGYSTTYLLWFDQKQIASDTETTIMESLHSEDITESLNIISSEVYNAAIAESMAKETYRFVIPLSEGFTREDTSDSAALLYQNGKLVGGYNIVHFEKGILPNIQENQQMVIDTLWKDIQSTIDATELHGELTNEGLITIVFSNEETEYTHYILSFGQIGTQYDLWFQTSEVPESAIMDMVLDANLEQE